MPLPTTTEIENAKAIITHGCDGPVTPFVLVSRAVKIGTEAAANALFEELEARRWLSEAALNEEELPSPADS
jgi:hypothetical protein